MATIDIPLPNNSVTNTQATQKKTSLYHTCRYVLQALSTIDSLQSYLVLPDTMTEIPFMSRLWHFCRQGTSLCLLFNTLGPKAPIPLVEQDLSPTPVHKPKHYVYHFIIACLEQLPFDSDSFFSLTDVFEDDTNGFVRVR
jgi:cell division control protein 24